MYPDEAAYVEMAQKYVGAEDEAIAASFVWRMERERGDARVPSHVGKLNRAGSEVG